eukprot:GAFH01001002.1.p1 GENE.GAFH01001002.1~~GAFH01001002.1.p1  ORF type:complete len:553 (+),score=52.95 GAFH01001002.1:451-2109(+)
MLRILHVPSDKGLPEGALCRILSHLPGLERFAVGCVDADSAHWPHYGNWLLSSIGHYCPNLRHLTLLLHRSSSPDLVLLQPCCILRHLTVSHHEGVWSLLPHLPCLKSLSFCGEQEVDLDWTLAESAALKRLEMPRCSHDTLATLLQQLDRFEHLTALTISCQGLGPETLPGLLTLLRTAAGTLTSVHLNALAPELAPDLLLVISALPRISDLAFREAAWPQLPPIALPLDRLERFTLQAGVTTRFTGLHLVAPVLRELRLQCLVCDQCVIECPLLECLELPALVATGRSPAVLQLRCPNLRRLTNVPTWREFSAGPMPHLDTVVTTPTDCSEPPWVPLLLEWPSLATLEGITISDQATLEALCSGSLAPSLTTIRGLSVRVPRLFSVEGEYGLRLGPAVHSVDVCFSPSAEGDFPTQLTVFGAALRHFKVTLPSLTRLVIHSCVLNSLSVPRMEPRCRVDLTPGAPLCELHMGQVAPASEDFLASLLLHVAPTLRRLSLGLRTSTLQWCAMLNHTLAQLPRLHTLTLAQTPAHLTLHCPSLVELHLPASWG